MSGPLNILSRRLGSMLPTPSSVIEANALTWVNCSIKEVTKNDSEGINHLGFEARYHITINCDSLLKKQSLASQSHVQVILLKIKLWGNVQLLLLNLIE